MLLSSKNAPGVIPESAKLHIAKCELFYLVKIYGDHG